MSRKPSACNWFTKSLKIFLNNTVQVSGFGTIASGLKILDYGKLTLDYKNKKSFFEPYSNN